uniref:Uncharacterized protein n=1 Tax=Bubo bubo TaxID=30461 RepID=A0A8C0F762_BUBBB
VGQRWLPARARPSSPRARPEQSKCWGRRRVCVGSPHLHASPVLISSRNPADKFCIWRIKCLYIY